MADKEEESKDSGKEDFEGDALLFDEKKEKKEHKEKKDNYKDREEEDDEDSEDNHRKSRHAKSKKAGQKDDDYVIKIRLKKLNYTWLERIAYWIVIIILLVMIIKGSSFNINLGGSDAPIADDDINNSPVIADNTTLTNGTDNQTTNPTDNTTNTDDTPADTGGSGIKLWIVKDGACTEVDITETGDGKSYGTKAKCEELSDASSGSGDTTGTTTEDCDGEIEIEILNVEDNYNDNPKGIESIEVIIRNEANKDIKGFWLDIFWYNGDDGTEVRNQHRLKAIDGKGGKLEYDNILSSNTIAKCTGTKRIIFDDELSSHFTSTREIDNTIKVQMFDFDDNDELLAEGFYTLNEN